MWRKRILHSLLVGMKVVIATLEIIVENLLNSRKRPTIWSRYYTSWHTPKNSIPYSTNPCSAMSIAALFSITRKYKQPKCSSTNTWIMKTQYNIVHIYTMKYYLVMKNEIIKLARKWFNLEKIIFCGGNHDPQ